MKSGEKKSGKKCTQTLKLCGMSREKVTRELSDTVKKQKNGPAMEIIDAAGEVYVRLIADTSDEKEARKQIKPLVREIKRRVGKNLYATDEQKTLEEAIVEVMRSQKLTLAMAESCTGGMLSARIVSVPGASEVFREGFVTYTDKAKQKRLLVKKGTLKKESAVSAKTAKEMARGGCTVSGADACISVTGYAGPDGGTKEKPVGTVFIGCCLADNVTVKEYHFEGDRRRIREQAASYGLALLWECLLSYTK